MKKIETLYDRYYETKGCIGDIGGRGKAMYLVTFRILETEDEHFYETEFFNHHWPLHGLGLPDAVLKKISSRNAASTLHQLKRP